MSGSSAVVIGRLAGLETFTGPSEEGVAYQFEVVEVLRLDDGVELLPGQIEFEQDRSPASRRFADLDASMPTTARVVAVLYQPNDPPPKRWITTLEGLWIECLDDDGDLALGGDIITTGAWESITTLDLLVDGVRGPADAGPSTEGASVDADEEVDDEERVISVLGAGPLLDFGGPEAKRIELTSLPGAEATWVDSPVMSAAAVVAADEVMLVLTRTSLPGAQHADGAVPVEIGSETWHMINIGVAESDLDAVLAEITRFLAP